MGNLPKVLVADDDVSALAELSELLELNGISVISVNSGEMAWKLFGTEKPNLVITDILMPGIDGITLLKLIKEVDDIIPVVMITGFGEIDTAISALRLGAFDFLLKPINGEILISTIQKGLEHHRLKVLENEYTHRLESQVEIRTRELAKTNEFLRGILESSRRVSIIVTDIKKTILFWNSGAENIFGYNQEEMLGQSVSRLYPADVDLNEARNILHEALKNEFGAAPKVIKQVSKDLREIVISLAISPMLDRKGKITGVVGLGQDITEQFRLHEELLESYTRIRKIQGASIFALAQLAEARDGETGAHLKRIRQYCEVLCGSVRKRPSYCHFMTSEFVEDLVQCSVLHDIGKIVIPDEILFKRGKYATEEYDVMQEHAVLGGKALSEAAKETGESQSYLSVGAEVAYYHHERWDGAGYPFGLCGVEIPLSARIVSLCDVYDALRSKRRYKESFSHERSMSIIIEERAKQFDPEIVDAFLDCQEGFRNVVESSQEQQSK
ncbi:MAG: response regulator [Deltaproteobacteria bacterium]|nr:response regulator [Deltaproteobacteria bacterium]